MINLNLFCKKETLPMNAVIEEALVYQGIRLQQTEQKDMERVFARLFSSDDGKKALAYLQVMTFQRALSPNSADAELRYLEGQRAMVGTILRLIDRGRRG